MPEGLLPLRSRGAQKSYGVVDGVKRGLPTCLRFRTPPEPPGSGPTSQSLCLRYMLKLKDKKDEKKIAHRGDDQHPGIEHHLRSFTLSAKKKTTPHERRLVRFFSTTGANKAFTPSKFRNKFKASTFAAKPFIKVLECSRIINARNGVPCLFHDHILHLVVG